LIHLPGKLKSNVKNGLVSFTNMLLDLQKNSIVVNSPALSAKIVFCSSQPGLLISASFCGSGTGFSFSH
jgi:hypothetical protein